MQLDNTQKGFTLIEILLVLAILTILAGAVFVLIGDSDDTKIKSNLATAKTMLPFAQECLFNNSIMLEPTDAAKVGSDPNDIVCVNSITKWPTLSVSDCAYAVTDAANGAYEINCTWTATKIACNARNGYCRTE